LKHATVALPDAEVHYVEAGVGDPLLLIHGGHGSWTHWLANIAALAQHRRVVALDLPGFGGSHRPEPDYTVERYGAAISHFLDALRIERMAIAGFSFGGIVAGMAARREPARISHLVLVNTPGIGPSSPFATAVMKELTALSLRKGLRAGALGSLRRIQLFDHSLIDAALIDRMLVNLRQTRFVTRDLSSIARIDYLLSAITQPLLIFIGREDVQRQFGLAADLEVITRCAPHAQIWLVERAAHWLQYDRAALFNERVADFLG
jgi:pimeloyl-ACP methyl ester carboxylesterase